MNQASLSPGREVSAVPVLPATLTPASAAGVPVPSLTTLPSSPLSSAATFGDAARPSLFGFVDVIVRPPRPDDAVDEVRHASSTPPLAIAPATIAIWSGVTASVYWPIAVRAGSSFAVARQELARVVGVGEARGQDLVRRQVDRRAPVLPKRDIASCSSGQRLAAPASSEPIWAKIVLIECVSAFDRSARRTARR